jgi:hypothetical protein
MKQGPDNAKARSRSAADTATKQLEQQTENREGKTDNMDVGPVTETDLQGDLLEASGNPS